VLSLLWADIDFASKTLRVSGTLQRVQGKLERSEPKTRAGARTLLLPDVLVDLLAEHQRRQAEERSVWGAAWQDHDLVFPAERGTPMEPSNLHRSCATFLIAQGVHPRVVMEILGHSQISLTMNTYGHVLPETQRDATTKVADLFGKPGQTPEAPSGEEQKAASSTPEEASEEGASAEPTDEPQEPGS
jgi:integrase